MNWKYWNKINTIIANNLQSSGTKITIVVVRYFRNVRNYDYYLWKNC